MEVIRIIKVRIPLEGNEIGDIVEGFREIANKYGRKVKMEEIKKILGERFGAE